MHYRLRTLLILMAVLPPVLALGWQKVQKHERRQRIVRLVLSMDDGYSRIHPQRERPPTLNR